MATTATFQSKQTLDKHPDEVLVRSVDFADALALGESLSGTPTVAITGTGAPTISNVAIVGNKVRFKLSGGTAKATPYQIKVTVTVIGGAQTQTYIGLVLIRVTSGS